MIRPVFAAVLPMSGGVRTAPASCAALSRRRVGAAAVGREGDDGSQRRSAKVRKEKGMVARNMVESHRLTSRLGPHIGVGSAPGARLNDTPSEIISRGRLQHRARLYAETGEFVGCRGIRQRL